jgi:TonB-linked SusC/RagA family outer membrane protein
MKKKILLKACYASFAFYLLSLTGVQAQENKDSLVNVAFGTVAKEDLLGAVSTVNVSELIKKNYSTYSLDGLESFVGGYNGNIWGQRPLVLINGIPRAAAYALPTEIESVTVLKGANAIALYGSRASKGVILITTKRGEVKPLSLSVRANSGMYIPKAYPKYLNAADYMTLYSEAERNDAINGVVDKPKFPQDVIVNTAAGTNPYRYPDVDFFTSDYLKSAYNKTDVTGEISGGNEKSRYYTNFGMSYNSSLMKYGEQKNNNDMRFNIRSNIDIDVTDWLTASVDALVIFADSYRGKGNFWGSSATLRPNSINPYLPVSMLDPNSIDMQGQVQNSKDLIDGMYLLQGSTDYSSNVFADMLALGYSKSKTRAFQFNANVAADLGVLTKGLSFKTCYAVDYTDAFVLDWNETYKTYLPSWSKTDPNMVLSLDPQATIDQSTTSEGVAGSAYTQTLTFKSQFDYKRTFNVNHNVSAALIGWGYQIQESDNSDDVANKDYYHRTGNINMGLQVGYNYRHKYYVDFSGAMIHSAKLPEGNREAISPTVTLGWRISDEDFFKDNVSFVDNLKLTASYANLKQDLDIFDPGTGLDALNTREFYLYKGYFNNSAGYYTYRDGSGQPTVTSTRAANNNLTFIERNEIRVGLEANLLKNLVALEANYFVQNTNGGLASGIKTIYPSYFQADNGSFLPLLNFNEDKRQGIDFGINLNKKIGAVDFSLGFVGMYFTTEAMRRDEYFNDAHRYRVGKPLDSYWGLISEGFFMDQNEIDNSPTQKFGEVNKPGDIKYKDVNTDGVIDENDEVNLGHNGWSVSPFTYGVNLTMKWKNLTLFAMGSGQSGSIGFKNSSYYWVSGNGKYSEAVLDHWTEATKSTATYPRLTTTSGSNNFRNSTFWMYKTNRFDVRRVQITYDFPSTMFNEKSLLSDLSVYCSGENLLTISKERKLMETNIGSAPQTRFVNLGLKASF